MMNLIYKLNIEIVRIGLILTEPRFRNSRKLTFQCACSFPLDTECVLEIFLVTISQCRPRTISEQKNYRISSVLVHLGAGFRVRKIECRTQNTSLKNTGVTTHFELRQLFFSQRVQKKSLKINRCSDFHNSNCKMLLKC